MKDLLIECKYIDGVSTTPRIHLKADTGECEISGESYMENTYDYYEPVFRWLEDYLQDIGRKIKFVCKLVYYNTGTSGCLYTIMEVLKEFEHRGGKVEIYWYCNENDIDMQEDVQDVIYETGANIKLMTY
jgi:hypothetical protein